ncbi:hypothetical protein V5R04_13460 [Jonesiaceae bacterium BS-20]|uniref:Uncharacterized protein n=1 Tax=Jonesiaceae bacterium BS-20 TaxID=3120821 RepID=A0AAU7DW83_9MICO
MSIAIAAIALLLVTGGALVLAGVIPNASVDTHPPCDQLPTMAQVEAAIAANPNIVAQLSNQGPGISVRADSPGCEGKDQFLISVSYKTDDEYAGIREVLEQSNGFGVPVAISQP